MVEAGIGRGGDRRLGAIGDAEAGLAQHGKIIGAIADGECRLVRQAETGAQFDESVELGLLAEDRLGDEAGEQGAFAEQDVGAVLIEADGRADRAGEDGEAARDQRGIAAMGAHGADQRAAARCQRDVPGDDLIDDAERDAFQQPNALSQRRLEFELAAHGAFGDLGDLLLQADIGGELVDALLADHGRIHVGEEQALAAGRGRLDDDVDGGAGKRLAQDRFELARIVRIREEVGRDLAVEALGPGCRGGGTQACEQAIVEQGLTMGGDEGGDERHDGAGSEVKYSAVLIAGPTASGKSALAVEIARRFGGVVVNADSMQVYRDLHVITARPTSEEMGQVPHRLYGHIDGAVNHSAAAYAAEVTTLLTELAGQGALPVLVGGTGLYFKALTEGLSDIPPVPDEIRIAFRARAERCGTGELHAELAGKDPEMAARLRPSDRLRVMRALEVFEATGRSLATFQGSRRPGPLAEQSLLKLFLAPERELVRARIDQRFDAMMEQGALDEVAALRERRLDPLLPVMRAHGVPGLIAYLDGQLSLEEAVVRGKADTRAYAKRQVTWFRHQMEGWTAAAPEAALDVALAACANGASIAG